MKNYAFLLGSIGFLFLFFNISYACTCVPKTSPKQELEQSTVVFSGKVAAVKKHDQPDDLFADVEAVFEVGETWKGVDKQLVSVFTSSNSASCGYKFKKGQNYLVYANSDSQKRLVTGICTRTKRLKDAREDLDNLGEGKEVKADISDNPYNSELAKRLGADDYGMKTYVFAVLKTGKVKITDKKEIENLQNGHLKNITRLAEAGKLVLAGPFFEGGNERGIFIFNVPTIEEAKKLVETDPAVKAGFFEFELKLLYASAALPQLLPIHKKIQKKSIVEE